MGWLIRVLGRAVNKYIHISMSMPTQQRNKLLLYYKISLHNIIIYKVTTQKKTLYTTANKLECEHRRSGCRPCSFSHLYTHDFCTHAIQNRAVVRPIFIMLIGEQSAARRWRRRYEIRFDRSLKIFHHSVASILGDWKHRAAWALPPHRTRDHKHSQREKEERKRSIRNIYI